MANKPSGITWSRTYVPIIAGPGSVQLTSDGGFIVAGESVGAWVMKASSSGEPEWEREYAPEGYTDAAASSVQQTRDQGYILAGNALSAHYVTSFDAWLLKLDHKGNVQWSKTYGGSGGEGFMSVQQTRDGGYIAAGTTESFGPGVQTSGETAWVVRVDGKGNVVWQKDFGADDAESVQQTSDGGFIVAGTAAVGSQPNADAWVFKLDTNGNMVWQKTFEITTDNRGYSVRQTSNGGYVLTAEAVTLSPVQSLISSNAIVISLDANGNTLWQRSYSRGGVTHPSSIAETADDGFIVAGASRPTSYVSGINGPWLLKLDAKGNLVWEKTYGEKGDFFYQVETTRAGGLIVVGFILSLGSAWLLNLNSLGTIEGCAIGMASNGTLTEPVLIETNARIIDVNTNVTIASTNVTVRTPTANALTQCITIPGDTTKRTRD